MSNTIVTNYSNSSGNTAISDKSVVIIVNKDGTVSLEKDALHSLLEKDYDNTSVSIVRLNDDGKPDDASDHSSDETVPHINLTVDAYFDPSNKDIDKGIQNEFLSDLLLNSQISILAFQNDHCYTPLTSPSQSRRNSEVEVRKREEIVSAPVLKQSIPSSKKITVLENKIIAKGKNLHYFNASDIINRSDVKRTSAINPNIISIIKKVEPEKPKLIENVHNKKQEEDVSSENESSAEDKDDSDSDFNPDNSEDIGFDRSRRNRTILRKDIQKILSRKIELKNSTAATHPIMRDDGNHMSNKFKTVTKTYHRTIVDDRHKSPAAVKIEPPKPQIILNRKLSSDNDPKIPHKPEVKHEVQKIIKPPIKKDNKKPSAALLNDMTTLFSTPDVIRRISTETRPADKPSNISLLKKVDSQSFSSSNVIDHVSVPKSIYGKMDVKTYGHPTVKTQQKVMEVQNQVVRNQKECLDVMPTIDEASLAQLLQDPNHGILSTDNIPMVLNPAVSQSQVIENKDSGVMMTPVPLSSGGMNAPLSPSLDLLSGLHPDEEGLTEELLRHVAQLVESSENFQQVIDKQVLGKDADIPTKTIPKPPIVLHKPEPVPEILKPQPSFNQQPKKEPVQIMRSNGRIITLPPIEAPATRSKRKNLLNTSVEQQPSPNTSLTEMSKPVLQTSPVNVPKQSPTVKHVQKHMEQQMAKISTMHFDKKDEDAESDESWNSEDDPDRLWCICKQPHNNRFMICCDMCEDWFHGKCVNVTKAMGQEMEEKGMEWRCPNCIKKKSLATTPMKAPTIHKSTESKMDDKISVGSSSVGDSSTTCIVCKKPARASSIYCSDACILKHAQESIIIASPPNVNAKNPKDINKPRMDTRVTVYERKSGKFLVGNNAPTAANLKSFLQEHPTFEVVRTNMVLNREHTPQKVAPRPRPQQPQQTKVQSVLTLGHDRHLAIAQPALKSPTQTIRAQPKQTIPVQPLPLKSPPQQAVKTQPPKPPLKSPTTPKTPVSHQKPQPLKSPTSPLPTRKDQESIPRRYSGDPIRDNVKKALQEQISLRMAESKDVSFTPEEIKKFSVDTEYELHDLFRDVGAKYKAKYRSLMFNLKDRKNLTLWQKICNKSITAKQLVRLSPEELASQELAQWRDQETKHQLELIKKSELDLLQCNKTYVLKTHKGEEVMESRTTGTAELDPNVSVNDLVTALNKSSDNGAETESSSKPSSPVMSSLSSKHTSSSHHKHSRNRSRSHKSSRSNHSSSKTERSSSRHHSSKDSKSDSRSHHRKSSKDREKSDRSRSSRHHSERSRRSSHSRSKSRSKQSEGERKHSRSHDKRRSTSPKDDKSRDMKLTDIEESSLIKLENIKSPVIPDTEGRSPYSDSIKSPLTPDLNTGGESDQEPSSTVDAIAPAIWCGCIAMVDVAKFNVSSYEVSGQSDDIIIDLEPVLDVVGRINPDSVWDYIAKMKKQFSKDILIIRFSPLNDDEKKPYNALYSYLASRNRLGVVKVGNGGIKDFYIVPLESNSPVPAVLTPLYGGGFDDIRPNMLLGVLVKQRRKRPSSHTRPISSLPPKIAKLGGALEKAYTPPNEGSYTPPPGSPKRKMTSSSVLTGMPLPAFLPNLSSTVKDQIAASLASADDEPYSPGGSDSGSLDKSNSPKPQIMPRSSNLQQRMEELTRKIEEEKKQIQNMAGGGIPGIQDEPYSPSRPMSPPINESSLPILSNISLPSNIHEILANIQSKTKESMNENRPVETYVPTAMISNTTGDVDMRVINPPPYIATMPAYPHVETSNKSKLSTLSEAELLSMVPDEVLLPARVYPPLPSAPPLPVANINVPPPPYKKKKMDYGQPPPPGLDDS